MLAVLWSVADTFAGGATVAGCYAAAESENPGRSIQVKLGSTTLLTSVDLDAVFDKIAEKHTDPTLDVAYNAAGRAAMRQALDCIFDAEHFTVSSIWLNEHESELAMRNYTVALFESGSPKDYYTFDHVFTYSSTPYVGFTSPLTGGCFNIAATGFGSNDHVGDLNNNPGNTRCDNVDCDDGCSGGGDALCTCPSSGGCASITGPDNVTGSNGSILKVIYN